MVKRTLKNKSKLISEEYKKLIKNDLSNYMSDNEIDTMIHNKINIINKVNHLFNINFFNLTVKNQARMIYNLNTSPYIGREMLDQLQNYMRTKETDFRNLISQEYLGEDREIDSFLRDMIDIALNKDSSEFEVVLTLFNVVFVLFRDSIGNPFTWCSYINFEEKFINNFQKIKDDDYLFYTYWDYYEIMHNNLRGKRKNLCYAPLDLHTELLGNTIDEILMKINNFFDLNFYYFFNEELLTFLLDKLTKLNISINKCISNHKTSSSLEMSNIMLAQYDSKNNRDNYFKSLDFLTEEKNANQVDINLKGKKNINYNYEQKFGLAISKLNRKSKYIDNLPLYCYEKKVQKATFDKNLELLKTFERALDISIKNKRIKTPHIGFVINLDNALCLKVFFQEFIIRESEHTTRKNKMKSSINISTRQIMKNIICTVDDKCDFLTKDEKKLYSSSELYSKNEYYDIENNEDSNIIYKLNLLLSEKIRRGYYREFNKMECYKKIFTYKKDLRDTLTSIFTICDIDTMFNIVLTFYADLCNIISNFEKSNR